MTTKTIMAVSLAAVFAISMILTPAFALVMDPKNDSSGNSDQDLKSFGLDDQGNPSLKVWGHAGDTKPIDGSGLVNAYVLVTDDGIYAVTSHAGIEDSSEVVDDGLWHAHKVTLNESGCVTSLSEDGDAWVHGNQVAVTGTSATTVNAALIVQLTTSEGVCVGTVYDSP